MITSLQHFALGVPKLEPGVDFYTTFGLQCHERSNHLAFRCHGRDQDQVVLIETGRARKFHHLSLGTHAAGLEYIAAGLQARGITRLDPPYLGAPLGLWFADPDGNLVNVQVAESAPRAPESARITNTPGRYPRTGTRGCPAREVSIHPRRLGHLILFTPNVPRQQSFYCDVLGMQLSDTLQNEYGAFLRTRGGSDHHVIGLLNSATPGFHHASFELGSIDEAELGAMQLRQKGYKHAWGPGRHVIGSNYFHYFRDPWNGMAEYFFDIDFIPETCVWEPRDWAKQDGMFLWSADGPPPPDFGNNYENA